MLNEWSDRPPLRWRASMFGRRSTRWRDTREEAEADAIRKGWASRADHHRAPIFLTIGVVIEQEAPRPRKWLGPE